MFAIVVLALLSARTYRLVHSAPFRFLEDYLLRLFFHGCPDIAMNKANMERVDAVLNALQPVAVIERLDIDVSFAFSRQKVKPRQK